MWADMALSQAGWKPPDVRKTRACGSPAKDGEREKIVENCWRVTADQTPPKGEPLIVTIQCKWKKYREVLAPVYYLYDKNYAEWIFWDESSNSVIGPGEVKVVAWMPWPDPSDAEVEWG